MNPFDPIGLSSLYCLGRILDVLTHIHAQGAPFTEVQIVPPGQRLILWEQGQWIAEIRVSFMNGVIQISFLKERGSKKRIVGGLEVLLEHFGVEADWRHPIANDITRLACLATGQTDPMFPRLLFTNVRFLFKEALLILNAGYGEICFQALRDGTLRFGSIDEKPQTMMFTEWGLWIQRAFGYDEVDGRFDR